MKIPYDKKLHFIVGLAIAIIFAVIFKSAVIGFLAAYIAGIAKEIRDEIAYGGFDWIDFIVTVLGGSVGALIYFLIERI